MNDSPTRGQYPGQVPGEWGYRPVSQHPLENTSGQMASMPPPEHHEFRPGQSQPYGGEPPAEYIHSTRMAPPAGPWHPPLTTRPPATRHTARHRPSARPRAGRYPWWLTAAAAMTIAGAAATAVLLTTSAPAAPPGSAGQTGTRGTGTAQPGTAGTSQAPPAVSRAQAQHALAAYTTANNQANKLRSDNLLAAIETGSSYQMDTGIYRFQRTSDPANRDYTSLVLTGPTFYIPREAASVYPHWFAAKVTYRYPKNPQIPPAPGYVLFTQASPGAPWKNTYEPNVLAGSSPRRKSRPTRTGMPNRPAWMALGQV